MSHHTVKSVTIQDNPNSNISSTKCEKTPPPTKLESLPYPPTKENIPKLKSYIEEQFASSAFNKSATVAIMNTLPACIHLKPGFVPCMLLTMHATR